MIKEFNDKPLVNYRLMISYDGRNYFGWQRHSDMPTIQLAIERAISESFGFQCKVIGSGRTDRGTHATGQIANVHLPLNLDPVKAVAVLNERLNYDIQILEFSRISDEFHAREAAVCKLYRYIIWNTMECPKEMIGRVWHVPEDLDIVAMRRACRVFVGKHDFASFATKPRFRQKSTVRTILLLNIEYNTPKVSISICADGFLYKMVRNIVRALVKVGEGRYTPRDLEKILSSKDRKVSPGTAPSSGLYLDEVYYQSPKSLMPPKKDLTA